mgnify:CR=1 FL=1
MREISICSENVFGEPFIGYRATGCFTEGDLKLTPGQTVARDLKRPAAKAGVVGKHGSNEPANVFHGGKLNRLIRPDEGNQTALIQTETGSYKHFHENHRPDDGGIHVEQSDMGFDTRLCIKTRNACQFVPDAGARRINKMVDAGFGSDIRNRNAMTDFVLGSQVGWQYAKDTVSVFHRCADDIDLFQ